MRHAHRRIVCTFILAATASLGCESQPETPSQTEVEIFREEQRSTVTPHGEIIPESVHAGPDETVEYQTTDGRHWRTDMRERADGTHSWAEPDEISQTSEID